MNFLFFCLLSGVFSYIFEGFVFLSHECLSFWLKLLLSLPVASWSSVRVTALHFIIQCLLTVTLRACGHWSGKNSGAAASVERTCLPVAFSQISLWEGQVLASQSSLHILQLIHFYHVVCFRNMSEQFKGDHLAERCQCSLCSFAHLGAYAGPAAGFLSCSPHVTSPPHSWGCWQSGFFFLTGQTDVAEVWRCNFNYFILKGSSWESSCLCSGKVSAGFKADVVFMWIFVICVTVHRQRSWPPSSSLLSEHQMRVSGVHSCGRQLMISCFPLICHLAAWAVGWDSPSIGWLTFELMT